MNKDTVEYQRVKNILIYRRRELWEKIFATVGNTHLTDVAESELESAITKVEQAAIDLYIIEPHAEESHSHRCVQCQFEYTPTLEGSGDCPACGCDGTLTET